MKYDYNLNCILLGPASSGKTLFINNYLNKSADNYPTIGVDFHKIELKHIDNFYKLNLWETGNGLLYKNLINDFLYKSQIFIIMNKTIDIDFIYSVYDNISKNVYRKLNLIIIIYNKINEFDNFKYDEEYIINLNKNLIVKFFYIDIKNKSQINQVFNFIKTYMYQLQTTHYNTIPYNNQNSDISCKINCCNIC